VSDIYREFLQVNQLINQFFIQIGGDLSYLILTFQQMIQLGSEFNRIFRYRIP